MKKTVLASVAILSFIICAFAQAPVSSSDSLKSAQKIETVSFNKKTSIVTPKPPTNWSKIKDLFR
jgi:hypothetical protein